MLGDITQSLLGQTPMLKKARARTPAKSSKFFQEKSNLKDSHPHIIEWFDSSGTNSAVQTEIIEQCFKKEGRVWKLDLEKPFLKESKKRCVSSIWKPI